jgi:ABC-2 type transport system permease protein
MRRLLLLTRSLLLINLRNRTVLFWNLAFPIGLLAINGLIFAGQGPERAGIAAWLAVGIVILNVMSSGLIGDSAWLTTMRDQGILQRVRAAPLPSSQLVIAYGLVRMTLMLVQSALIILAALLIFGASFTWGGLAAGLLWTILGASVFVLLGQALAGVAPNAGAALVIAQSFYFPLMFISNLFTPSELLPGWLMDVSRWSPAFMLVDLVRPTIVAIEPLQAAWLNALGLLAYGALGLLVAARFFRWEPRR